MSKEAGNLGSTLTQIFKPFAQIMGVMSPMTNILTGFLEPLEPLTDLLGTVGSILGTALVPIVAKLLEFVMPFMPILVAIANILSPLLIGLFNFFIPLDKISALFAKLASFIPPDVGKWFAELPKTIESFFSGLPAKITTALNSAGLTIVNFFTVTLPKAFTDLMATIGQVLADVWVEISSLGVKKTKTFG